MPIKCSKCYGSIDGKYYKCTNCSSIFHTQCVSKYKHDDREDFIQGEGKKFISYYYNCPDCNTKVITSKYVVTMPMSTKMKWLVIFIIISIMLILQGMGIIKRE